MRGGDVAVYPQRYRNVVFDFGNQVVRGPLFVHLLAGAAVDGKCGDACLFGHFGHRADVFVVFGKTEAGFQRDGNVHRRHHRAQDVAHQFFVLQQRAARQHVADFFYRAAHVDVDNLRAVFHIVACGLGHLFRVAARNLHRPQAVFAVEIAARQAFFGVAQRRVAGQHLADGVTRAETAGQPSERFVGNAGHRREGDGRGDAVGADAEHIGNTVETEKGGL